MYLGILVMWQPPSPRLHLIILRVFAVELCQTLHTGLHVHSHSASFRPWTNPIIPACVNCKMLCHVVCVCVCVHAFGVCVCVYVCVCMHLVCVCVGVHTRVCVC